jgi:imidazolonepropionase-like amidohydrolase
MSGSDSAWGYYRAGNGWLEIHALTDAGLSTTEALVAGTSGSAEAIGVGGIAGRLAAGRQADILVVPGDPIADLDVLGRPLDVFQAGRRVRQLAG